MQGTRDPAAWLTVPAALAFRARARLVLASPPIARCWRRTPRAGSPSSPASPPLSTPEFCAPQMVAMPLPDVGDPVEFQRQLMERYRIEIPVFKWQEHSIARLSVQGYNCKAQMDLLIEALTEMLGLGASRPELALPARLTILVARDGSAIRRGSGGRIGRDRTAQLSRAARNRGHAASRCSMRWPT